MPTHISVLSLKRKRLTIDLDACLKLPKPGSPVDRPLFTMMAALCNALTALYPRITPTQGRDHIPGILDDKSAIDYIPKVVCLWMAPDGFVFAGSVEPYTSLVQRAVDGKKTCVPGTLYHEVTQDTARAALDAGGYDCDVSLEGLFGFTLPPKVAMAAPVEITAATAKSTRQKKIQRWAKSSVPKPDPKHVVLEVVARMHKHNERPTLDNYAMYAKVSIANLRKTNPALLKLIKQSLADSPKKYESQLNPRTGEREIVDPTPGPF
jgi:hypothetical protein